MGIILAIIQFLLIAYICLFEVRRKSSAAFMWATLMVMFGVMHLYSVFTEKSEYSLAVLNKASLFVIGFCFVYLVVRVILSSTNQEHVKIMSYESLEGMKTTPVKLPFLVFAIVSMLLVWEMIAISGGLLDTSWGASYVASSNLSYANEHQLYIITYFALGGIPLLLWIQKKHTLSIVSLALIGVVSVVTRNRILVLPLLVFVIAIILLKLDKIRVRHFIFAIIAAVAVIYIVYGLRVFRHYGTIEAFLRNFNLADFIDKINLYIATDNGELGLRNDFYYFIKNNNDFEGFGKGASYIRMLLVYIPTRFSFGLKPNDFAQTMGAAIGMVKGGSTHPTLFGDCYANLGGMGVFLGAFWATYCSIADKIVIKCKEQQIKILVYGLFAVTFVIIGRGSVYNSFFQVAWGIPFLVIFYYFLKRMPKFKWGNKKVKK